ncbi:MAG: GOLPH3/VPS74 family protein [Nocardioides sp.]
MLIAEDLLLLLTGEVTGRLVWPPPQVDVALGGAMLLELALAERVGLDERRRVRVDDPSPTGDPFLDRALTIIAARRDRKPQKVVVGLGKRLRPALYQRLAAQGVLRAGRRRILGLVPQRTWPAQDGRHQVELRQALDHALVVGVPPQPRTAALVGLLHALRATHKVVRPAGTGLRRREIDRRAKDLAEGDWVARAVRKAVDDVRAATVTAGST